ncbi:MAG: lysophospholipid acyltransferase family protein [Alphaproteobacteria bacterium]|nr:lysophospholipid acyltransferase family protein [Alphaproteobacteria bacterium]
MNLLKKLTRRITRSDRVQGWVCWLAARYIRHVYRTGRWETVGDDVPRRYWEEGRPFILAFWHGRILMMPYCWDRTRPINMLISQHRDGQLIARTVGHFGIATVAGSSSQGGSQALRLMLKALRAGEWVGITPDGPRGPRMRASQGVVSVARMAGVPVIPVTYATARRKVLGSWDRFLVALPFTRGVFWWGQPIAVPRDADAADLEEFRRRVEDELNAITAAADRYMGTVVVEPALPSGGG